MIKMPFQVFGKGYPVILLNGWGWQTSIWDEIVNQFTQFSFHVGNLETKDSLDEILLFLLHSTPPQSIWMGWSLGGMIAWKMAIEHPQHVFKLITIASTPKFLETSLWKGVSVKLFNQFFANFQNQPKEALTEFLSWQLFKSKNDPFQKRMLKTKLVDPTQFFFLTDQLKLLSSLDFRKEIQKTRCSSLHLFGKQDPLVPVNILEFIKTELPLSQCEIFSKSSHIPFVTEKNKFIQVLKQFLL